jgi:hypothetical protein
MGNSGFLLGTREGRGPWFPCQHHTTSYHPQVEGSGIVESFRTVLYFFSQEGLEAALWISIRLELLLVSVGTQNDPLFCIMNSNAFSPRTSVSVDHLEFMIEEFQVSFDGSTICRTFHHFRVLSQMLI